MVESFEQSSRNIKKHVPNIVKIKEIIVPVDWPKRFGYPIDEAKAADYLVIYEPIKDFGGTYLIEAAGSNLRKELKQLKASAEVFRGLGVHIDNYLIVLCRLSSADKKKYKLVKCLPKPFKYIVDRKSKDEKFVKIFGKKVRFIYEKEVERV